jgi:hypothetical protein
MEAKKVFIGWSGERSEALARALRAWLPCFCPSLTTWTSNDLTPGQRWQESLSDRLRSTSWAVLCVTPDNQDSPWMNFEAGMLAASTNNETVIPYCAGHAAPAPEGPLHQFQAVPARRQETLRMLEQHLPKNTVNAALFETTWPLVERVVQAVATGEAPPEAALGELENLQEARRSLRLDSVRVPENQGRRNLPMRLDYRIETKSHGLSVWLGASLWREDRTLLFNLDEDAIVSLRRGTHHYFRQLTIPAAAAAGDYKLNAEVWYGPKSSTDNSFALSTQWNAGQIVRIE